MMDAGIPLKAAAAGIAMGLIYDNGQTAFSRIFWVMKTT